MGFGDVVVDGLTEYGEAPVGCRGFFLYRFWSEGADAVAEFVG